MIYLMVLFFALINTGNAQQTFNKLTVKELDVSSRVNVVSTTKSSKPCPAMTTVQRDAIASPLAGSCVYNTTDLELNVYNGSLWQSAGGGGVENWTTATVYEVDDVVIESNKIYQCETAHTSGTFATDLSGGKWVQLANDVSTSVGTLPIANGGTGNTSGQATVNANLTGPITSVGNATSIASQTGTGSTFVVQTSPSLTTPNIGVASGSSLTLSTPLGAASGGTGQSSLTSGSVLVGNGTSAVSLVAPGTAGNVLTSNGATWTSATPPTALEPMSSASVGTTGVVSNEKGPADFITGNCTDANPSVCTINSFSFTPNCVAVAQTTADRVVNIDNVNNTTVLVYQRDGTGALARTAFKLICHGE